MTPYTLVIERAKRFLNERKDIFTGSLLNGMNTSIIKYSSNYFITQLFNLYLIIIPGTNVTEMKGNGSSLQGVYSL